MEQPTAIEAGWLYLHRSIINQSMSVDALKARLTYRPLFAEDGAEPMRLYDDARHPDFLGIPRAVGHHLFPGIAVTRRTTDGEEMGPVPRLPSPHHPRVLEPERQAKFMEDLYQGMLSYDTFLASAPTGSGKTVCLLHAAARLGRKTLILVHLERLMDQWIEEIHDKLGIPLDQIGRVQGDRCDYEGKPFVVGMLHSVCLRSDYPKAFYQSFGLVVFDEVHKVGAPLLSKSIHQFPARRRVGLSATIHRQDGGDRVYTWHLGLVRVRSQAIALPCKVHVIDYTSKSALWGNSRSSRVKCLTLDHDRNMLLTKVIKSFYDRGRKALIVSDNIDHLQVLMVMAEQAGVPSEVMGQFTGEVHRVAEVADKTTGRMVKKKVGIKRKATELKAIKAGADLIFATYQMMTEGIDIPRLDAGLDATPRSSATRVIGRIRRPVPDKPMPIWVTIRDTRCSMMLGYFKKRCKDYASSQAEVSYGKTTERRSPSGTHQAVV